MAFFHMLAKQQRISSQSLAHFALFLILGNATGSAGIVLIDIYINISYKFFIQYCVYFSFYKLDLNFYFFQYISEIHNNF